MTQFLFFPTHLIFWVLGVEGYSDEGLCFWGVGYNVFKVLGLLGWRLGYKCYGLGVLGGLMYEFNK